NLVVTHRKNLPGYAFGAIRAEIDRQRRDFFRAHFAHARDAFLFLLGLGRNRIDHARPGEWRDAIRADIEPCHVERDAARQSDNAHLRGHVIGLAEIADEPRGRGHVHEATETLLAKMRGTGTAHGEAAVQVHIDDV